MKRIAAGCVAIAAAIGAIAAGPSRPEPAPANGVAKLLACRGEADPQRRLACFDAQAAALDTQQQAHEVVVLDADEVRRTRRSLFGLTLPDLAILGQSKAKGGAPMEDVSQVTDTIREAHQLPRGEWALTLASGAHWVQTDAEIFSRDPAAGQTVVIRRAALGSYMAKVERNTAVRVKRVE